MFRKMAMAAVAALCAGGAAAKFNGKVVTADGRPMAGVVVTDGRNTKATDAAGAFELPGYDKTRFITITTPSGYKADRYYIPTADSIASYDFRLTATGRRYSGGHKFIQITDTEIHNRGAGTAWVDYLREYIAAEQPAFLIHTGDICYETGLREHITTVNSGTMDCPVYYAIGNHDLVNGDYGEQLFQEVYGPTWYSFDVGDTHYVVTPMPHGDRRPSYTVGEVAQWLRNDLAMMAPGKSLVVFNHSILTFGDSFRYGPGDNYIDLAKYNLKAWIYGHWHYNYVRRQGSVYNVCTNAPDKGGIEHSASAFRVCDIDSEGNFSSRLHYCFVPRQAVVNAVAGDGGIRLSVNAYHSGSEATRVAWRVSDGRIKGAKSGEMRRLSDWNWQADIASPRGESTVEVTATFSDGGSATENVRIGGGQAESPVAPLWIASTGANIFMSSPVVSGDAAFVGLIDDDNADRCGIAAIGMADGAIKWKFSTRNSVKNSIAVDGGVVLAQDADGWLYAVDAADGRLKWERFLMNDDEPYLCEGLSAANGVVYAGAGRGLGAYRVEDGQPLWINKAWKTNEGASSTITVGDGVLVTGSQWGALYGHDAATGELLWSHRENGLSNRGSTPVLHDGKLYVVSGRSLFEIAPRSGEILRRKEFPEYSLDATSTPLFHRGGMTFGTADRGVLTVNASTWAPIWNFRTGTSLVFTAPYTTPHDAAVETSPAMFGDAVWFGASDGTIYALDPVTGRRIYEYRTGAPLLSGPTVCGDTILFGDLSGCVYAFKATGK